MKTTKNCLNCEKPYVSNFFAERSKYCSRPCLIKHKKKLRMLRNRELSKGKTNVKKLAKYTKQRKEELKQATKINKNFSFVKNPDGTHQFGENILTLKNYKEPLKEIPKKEGVGWYGTIASDTVTGKIQCHLCGQFFDGLVGHIFRAHKMKTREYREKFGLAYTTALVSETERMRLKQGTLNWLKTMTPEQRIAYRKRSAETLNKYRHLRGSFQPKKTLEGMNKDGSCPDQTLQAIIDVKEALGHVPTKKEFIEYKGSQRYVHLIYKHFGSWSKAIELCGFKVRNSWEKNRKGVKSKSYSEEELLDLLMIYTQENQQIPTASDWKRDLLPSYDTYLTRFGSIENARQLAGVYTIVQPSKKFQSRSKYYRKAYKENQV